MLKITVKCIGCGKKQELIGEEAKEQPFCSHCGNIMIAQKVEMDTRKGRISREQ